MANRRMFSHKIINSAKFLKMPSSTQALYFHLGMNADDDGIVEAFTTMRLIGSTEDDLKILVAKQFVTVLNDDLVTFINDWLEHNLIRADRKIDSIYKDLLLKIVGEVKLIEPRHRADRAHSDDSGTSQGQQNDSIGKDRLGKDRLEQDKKINKKEDVTFDYSDFTDSEIKSINDWLSYKKERKESYKPTGLKHLRSLLIGLKEKNILEQSISLSIANNWMGIHESKNNNVFTNDQYVPDISCFVIKKDKYLGDHE